MINQLFDVAAIRQNVEEVSALVAKIKGELSNLSIKVKIDSPGDIVGQINQLNTSYKELSKTLGELTASQLRAAKAETEKAKQDTEQAKQATELAKREKELAKAETERARAATELAKQKKMQNSHSRQTIVTEQQVNAILGVEARTMAEAAEQNRILRAAAKQLDLTEKENIQTLRIYNEQINKNTEFIRQNSDAATKQKMNIGNYQSVWKGLNTSVQQIVREAPAAKYGMDIFFLAISNNIPMLMDAIQGIRTYNKELEATGQAHKKLSIGKEIMKSLISWQTLIMVGVTLLVNYGDEIINWVTKLFKGEKALDATAIAAEHLNEAWKEGNKSAVEETLRFNILTKAVSDNTLSMDKRKAALKELREQYPEHLKGLSDEQILTGQVGDAYEKIAKEIKETAIAQAQFNQAVKLGEKVAELQAESDILHGVNTLEDAEKKLEENRFTINKLISEGRGGTYIAGVNIGINEDGKRRAELNKQQKALEAYIEALKNLESYINGSALIKVESEKIKANKSGKSTDNYDPYTVGWYEKQISDLEEQIKKSKDTEVIAELNKKIQEYRDAIAKLKGEQTEYAQTLASIIGDFGSEPIEAERQRALEKIDMWYNEQKAQIKSIGGEYAKDEQTAIEALNSARLNKIQETNDKFDKEIEKEAKRITKDITTALKASLSGMDDVYTADEHIENVDFLNQETSLLERYNRGIINETEYQKELLAIKERFAREALYTQMKYVEFEFDTLVDERKKLIDELQKLNKDLEDADDANKDAIKAKIKGIEDALNMDELSGENIARLKTLIEQLEAEYNNLLGRQDKDAKDRDNNKTVPDILGLTPEEYQQAEQVVQGMADLMDEVSNLANEYYEARIEQIEKETEAVEASHERQLESLEMMYEQGAISQEEFEARKRLQEDLTAQKQEELEKKKIEMQIKQAKWDKANSIAQAAINTAVAITQSLATWWMIPIISAMGALQMATILATPLPKYAKGTDYHKGGLAIVGDGGKNEVVMTDNGAYITPDTPTIVNLPRGAKVLSDIKLLDNNVDWQLRPFLGGLSYNDKGEPIIINDYSNLEREQKLTRKRIEQQTKELRKIERNRQKNTYKRNVV